MRAYNLLVWDALIAREEEHLIADTIERLQESLDYGAYETAALYAENLARYLHRKAKIVKKASQS